MSEVDDARRRRAIHRRSASIVASVAPFGGSSQFAAVEILGDGGSVASDEWRHHRVDRHDCRVHRRRRLPFVVVIVVAAAGTALTRLIA